MSVIFFKSNDMPSRPRAGVNTRLFSRFFILFIGVLISHNCLAKKPSILVFTKTAGFRHSSIGIGKKAIAKLGEENGFNVDTTSNADLFAEKSLKRYAAVVFLNTTGDVLNPAQEKAFEQYIRKGGGYVGVHAASDTEYDWEWYGRLVGAYFMNHPKQQTAKLDIVDATHISTKHLPNPWTHFDEFYDFKNISSETTKLILIDENSYEGGKNGDYHPMAWYQDFDGGRAFYTGLGHTDKSYSDPMFLQHLLGGIHYAIGK